MEDDSKTYTDFIFALMEKAVDTEENHRGFHPFKKLAASLSPDSPE